MPDISYEERRVYRDKKHPTVGAGWGRFEVRGLRSGGVGEYARPSAVVSGFGFKEWISYKLPLKLLGRSPAGLGSWGLEVFGPKMSGFWIPQVTDGVEVSSYQKSNTELVLS